MMADTIGIAAGALSPAKLKRALARVPIAGPLASLVWRRYGRRLLIRPPAAAAAEPYSFHWMPPSADEEEKGRTLRQVRNLLNYTKTSGQIYDARRYPAGYHTIEIAGERLAGQRDPAARLEKVPFDFTGRSVLDIGCNQGGMLFAVADRIRWGVGIDFDRRMVNAATRVARLRGFGHIDFFCHDLQADPSELVTDFLPERRADIVLLLSVCAWIGNWRETVRFAAACADNLLFESNGTDRQQKQQLALLGAVFQNVVELAATSDDDPRQKHRSLYLCSRPY